MKQIANWHSGANSASTAPTSLGASISSYSWTYDVEGKAASFTAPEGTFAYGYDHKDQLTSATFTVTSGYTGGTPASESFNFDNTGNRTGGGNSVTKNRLMSDGTYNYTYDGEGNRTSRTNIATTATILYSWDHRNRLTKVEYRNTPTGPATKIVANTYDAFDRRVMKQVDDNGDATFDRTERYVWDGDQISLVLDASGAVLHRFLHGPAIDQVFADEDSVNGLLWDLGDHQNTTRDVINNSGTVVNHVTYSPFGTIASESDPTKTPFAAYTGRDWDEDLQLQYNRGRWYEPSTGRWLSEDPIGFAAGDTNLQRYVGNGPTNSSDPSGLYEVDFHFYAIYYIAMSRGWSESAARDIAGWSQYVDDDPRTAPISNGLNKPLLRDFHFYDSTPNGVTTANPESLRNRVAAAAKECHSGDSRDNRIRLGRLLHTFADTWSHEGYTAWWASINSRDDRDRGAIAPNIGHWDAPEGGEAPDHPYNNVEKALEAAKTIYGLFPRGPGRHVPWHVAERDLRAAFSSPTLRGPSFDSVRTHTQMEEAMRDLIERRFGATYRYNLNDFAARRIDFLRVLDSELPQPSIPNPRLTR